MVINIYMKCLVDYDQRKKKVHRSCLLRYRLEFMMSLIQMDEIALESIKENTRPRYAKIWKEFVNFTGSEEDLAIHVPLEDEILKFLRYLLGRTKVSFSFLFNIIINVLVFNWSIGDIFIFLQKLMFELINCIDNTANECADED